ncbi:acetoacetate decarboxylase [Streptomyces sioyaensis]|uniref:acetoacetate decarboxylase n=1 Tax=Streptomyces sioyaensis TaxID=67364 RepID=UPI0037D64795
MTRANLFDMPQANGIQPFPEPPYYSQNREYFIVSYETDIELLKAIVPQPLEVTSNIVKYEFIRMPSYGLGDFTESGQVIPVSYQGEAGGYIHTMVLDGPTSIAAGRDIWGFPKRNAEPKLYIDNTDALVGTLDYGTIRIAQATMGLKHRKVPLEAVQQAVTQATFVVKNLPGVDGRPQICELNKFYLGDVTVHEAWTGPATLELFQHALVPMAALPVRKVVSALHFRVDVTVDYGTTVVDYLTAEKNAEAGK